MKGSPKDVKLSFDDLPFKGDVVDLKETDSLQPTLRYKVVSRIFDTSSEQDMKDYTEALQKMADGTAIMSDEKKKYCEDTKHWRVFLTYSEMFYAMPEKEN